MATFSTIRVPFDWTKTQSVVWRNCSGKECFLAGSACVVNGATAGSGGSAGVVHFKTPNTEYVLTMASTTMPAGMTAQEPLLGVESIANLQTIDIHVATSPSAAKGGYAEFTIISGD